MLCYIFTNIIITQIESILSDIMIQHQKDLLSDKAIEPKKKNKKNPFKKLEWVDGKRKL